MGGFDAIAAKAFVAICKVLVVGICVGIFIVWLIWGGV